ncbi:hypothetical protein L083_2473 [Actinoplanes sp. N902-109]|nr:hypothetical protein L083_2473 [Actinoplanes sp. N902-109]
MEHRHGDRSRSPWCADAHRIISAAVRFIDENGRGRRVVRGSSGAAPLRNPRWAESLLSVMAGVGLSEAEATPPIRMTIFGGSFSR